MRIHSVPHTGFVELFAKHIKPTNYLEIGCKCGQTLKAVRPYARSVWGVDPVIKREQMTKIFGTNPNTLIYIKTSDEFFVSHPVAVKFDLIFIDGKHTAEQVEKDFNNSLKVLADGGYIMMHDTVPETEAATHAGTGTVWEFIFRLKQGGIDIKELEFLNLPCIYGLTVVHKRNKQVNWCSLEDQFNRTGAMRF